MIIKKVFLKYLVYGFILSVFLYFFFPCFCGSREQSKRTRARMELYNVMLSYKPYSIEHRAGNLVDFDIYKNSQYYPFELTDTIFGENKSKVLYSISGDVTELTFKYTAKYKGKKSEYLRYSVLIPALPKEEAKK